MFGCVNDSSLKGQDAYASLPQQGKSNQDCKAAEGVDEAQLVLKLEAKLTYTNGRSCHLTKALSTL